MTIMTASIPPSEQEGPGCIAFVDLKMSQSQIMK